MKTFEEFLEEKFNDTREFCGRAITKDNCEDLFCAWLEDLDPQEFIDFGEEYGKYCIKQNEIDELKKIGDDMFKEKNIDDYDYDKDDEQYHANKDDE